MCLLILCGVAKRKMKLLMQNIRILVACALAMVIMPLTVSAAESEWQTEDMVRARLISERIGTEGQHEILLGVQVQLKEGWKTYWRNPGSSGLPPIFKWQGNDNIQSIAVEWPRPYSFDSFGIQSWGYKSEVIFPLRVTLEDAGKPITASLEFSYGVCEQVCVPVQQTLSLSLPAEEDVLSDHAKLLNEYRDKVPPLFTSQSNIETVSAASTGSSELEIVIEATSSLKQPMLIVEGEDGDYFEISPPVIEMAGRKSIFRITADLVDRDKPLEGREIVVTFLDKDMSLEERVLIK